MENIPALDIETTGFDFIKDEISAIGIKHDGFVHVFSREDNTERDMLVKFWKFLEDNNINKIVGFNSDRFDIPFITIRSLKWNVSVFEVDSIDLMMDLSFDSKLRWKGLNAWCQFFGIGGKNGDGKAAVQLFLDKKFEELHDYLRNDVEMTERLYIKLKDLNFIKVEDDEVKQ